ncbi:TlpA family protein disulfide reductase [Exiguobacterium artemiae]
MKKTPITYSVLYDTKGQSEKTYQLVAMPATYIIDQTGTIVGKHVGPVTQEMLKEMVRKIGG